VEGSTLNARFTLTGGNFGASQNLNSCKTDLCKRAVIFLLQEQFPQLVYFQQAFPTAAAALSVAVQFRPRVEDDAPRHLVASLVV